MKCTNSIPERVTYWVGKESRKKYTAPTQQVSLHPNRCSNELHFIAKRQLKCRPLENMAIWKPQLTTSPILASLTASCPLWWISSWTSGSCKTQAFDLHNYLPLSPLQPDKLVLWWVRKQGHWENRGWAPLPAYTRAKVSYIRSGSLPIVKYSNTPFLS